MIDDALKGDRLIGMVQNQEGRLANIGGLGRITQFSESEDGRYLIVLFDGFEADADIHNARQTSEALSGKSGDRTTLTVAMKALAKKLGVEIDWESLGEIPLPILINQAAMISPFAAEDKQSLLEAVSTDDRRRLLIGLMHLYASKDMGQNPKQSQQ